MNLGRLGKGEWIASVSAILLFALMFFDWFGAKTIMTSNLLFLFEALEPDRSAWDALDYIPFVLVVAIGVTLAVAGLRLTPGAQLSARINAMVGALGTVSALLILYRIVNPPVFFVESSFTVEGTVLFPAFLALAAAIGIALGGFLAMWEETASTSASGALHPAPPSTTPSSSR